MKTTMIVKTDKELKEKAREVAASFNMTLSSFINASMKQLVRDRRVEFSSGPNPSKLLLDSIAEAQEEYGSGDYKVFKSVNSLKKHLNA